MLININDPLIKTIRISALYSLLFFSVLYPILSNIKTISFLVCIILCLPGFISSIRYITSTNKYIFIYFFSICTIYLLLSINGSLNRSWTNIYTDAGAYYQYFSYLMLIYFIIYFTGESTLLFKANQKVLLFNLLLIFIGSYFSKNVYEYDYEKYGYVLSNLNSMEIYRQSAIFLLLLGIQKKLRLIFLVLLTPLIVSAQHVLLLLFMAIFLVYKLSKSLILLYLFSLILFQIFSLFFVDELFILDHNFGIRARFWYDSVQAVIDTKLLGVGFGTESIYNSYWSDGKFWDFRQEFEDIYSTSLHNGFYQLFFRFGIFSLPIITWIIFVLIDSLKLKRTNSQVFINFLVMILRYRPLQM